MRTLSSGAAKEPAEYLHDKSERILDRQRFVLRQDKDSPDAVCFQNPVLRRIRSKRNRAEFASDISGEAPDYLQC